MACEVPVIASKVGGIPEDIRNGQDGYLVEAHHVDMMAAKAIELLSDSSKHHAMGQNARQNASENFCAHKIIARYEAYYSKIMQEAK